MKKIHYFSILIAGIMTFNTLNAALDLTELDIANVDNTHVDTLENINDDLSCFTQFHRRGMSYIEQENEIVEKISQYYQRINNLQSRHFTVCTIPIVAPIKNYLNQDNIKLCKSIYGDSMLEVVRNITIGPTVLEKMKEQIRELNEILKLLKAKELEIKKEQRQQPRRIESTLSEQQLEDLGFSSKVFEASDEPSSSKSKKRRLR